MVVDTHVPVGYKRTEVGLIPEDWETPSVGDVCGFIVPGRNKPKLFNGDVPWITTPDLEEGKFVTNSRLGLCVSRSEAKAVGSKIVPPSSVLMSCAGELGIVAQNNNEVVVNQQLHVFIPTDCVDGTFLMNVLHYRKNEIAAMGTKTAVPYLNKNNCNSIIVPLPPLPEQLAIAQVLSDTDDLITSLDKLIAKKRDIKQGAMQELLTGKKRLPGFDKSQGRYKQTEVGMIPEDWEISQFITIVEKYIDYRGRTPKKIGMTWGGGNILALSANNVQMGKINPNKEAYLGSIDLYNKWMSQGDCEPGVKSRA